MAILTRPIPSRFGSIPEWRGEVADALLDGIDAYEFDTSAVSNYSSEVRHEIAAGIETLRSIRPSAATGDGFLDTRRAVRLAEESEDPVRRDQAVWSLARGDGGAVWPLLASVMSAPTDELATSALLAIAKAARHERDRAIEAFDEVIASPAGIEVIEWARLLQRDCRCGEIAEALGAYAAPISERDWTHLSGSTYDLTMPLIFQGRAVTRIGPLKLKVDISPQRFARVFGDAMACIRSETFETKLVLEKQVPGLHPDGSPHYELFAFSGASSRLAPGAWHHNYWASIKRPFYESGQVEKVTRRSGVIRDVPMTFCREAITATPEKYSVNGRPLPESVRGIFFGFGHLDVGRTIRQRMNLKAGDFQICSRRNPASGKLANTYFFGTFFGKLRDTDGNGRLVLNARPTHSTPEGKLDYHGDGSLAGDPVRPEDW